MLTVIRGNRMKKNRRRSVKIFENIIKEINLVKIIQYKKNLSRKFMTTAAKTRF